MDFAAAVASQPANLAASRTATTAALESVDLASWRSGMLGVVSMGAGSHAAHALVHRLTRYGRRVLNIDAADVAGWGPAADPADCYLLVSEGGRSRETIEAAEALAGKPRLAMTNNPAGPLSAAVDAVIGLGHGPDSKVYTVGYTASLQAFGLLATALDGHDDGDDFAALPALVESTLADVAETSTRISDALTGVTSIDFVASGPDRATAAEGALLFRESSRVSTAAFDTYQYLHGPMECLTSNQAVVLIGDGREVELAGYLAARGIPTVLITSTVVPQATSLVAVRIPAAAPLSTAVLGMLPLQLATRSLATSKGLGIDGFLFHQDDTKVGPPPAE